uniref:BAP29/BAP31 transmembrane domain-containing protein n=1 Tax=Chlamydomonas leiostraca TaxID=1034604 RepID=A0A7S0S5F4_9CHLO|mmetsp:Transcript_8500/g.21205  ORF Transcript_8500/g.21205 Transcript_8500/m.21205 type:complete len:137 (+) Transcript_8500:83-493(+)|eukprot:CAMPEP_0202859492 /NCGR_PEP_ID=MMETSP1391-20130828/1579_1 /ASSEMBLY_ACC=CAM_ASM_000867 /TAXON_ID=1034604 /ORGANISM="Chlamydomonas leiostraca, Strain SAG 11-49" /LENGTH=136 /DNA_ID=CAMNT_0049538525 /DNA_START=83 /DNA_END=493 /DNA_ORIENTATION=-
MLPSPGWFIFTAFLFVEALVVIILVAPMPSNTIRGVVLDQLVKLNERKGVRYGCWAMVALSGLYFWDSVATLWSQPYWVLSCEQRELLFFTERNAYATGMSLLLFFVLRRLLEIQAQLFVARAQTKAAEAKAVKQQ